MNFNKASVPFNTKHWHRLHSTVDTGNMNNNNRPKNNNRNQYPITSSAPSAPRPNATIDPSIMQAYMTLYNSNILNQNIINNASNGNLHPSGQPDIHLLAMALAQQQQSFASNPINNSSPSYHERVSNQDSKLLFGHDSELR